MHIILGPVRKESLTNISLISKSNSSNGFNRGDGDIKKEFGKDIDPMETYMVNYTKQGIGKWVKKSKVLVTFEVCLDG